MTPFRPKVILIRKFEICRFSKLHDQTRDRVPDGAVTRVCATEDKFAVVVVASYLSVVRNPVCFKA